MQPFKQVKLKQREYLPKNQRLRIRTVDYAIIGYVDLFEPELARLFTAKF